MCGNTVDDDGDGLVDFDDPDCLSPCDNDEAVLGPDLAGGALAENTTDCYWDANVLTGDDACLYDLRCDPESPGAPLFPYDPDLASCATLELSADCVARCLPMVPNGCDCLGCCQIGGETIFLGLQAGKSPSSCPANALDRCTSCTLQPDCFNPCESEACELCVLQDADELSPGCKEPACPPDVLPCATTYDCPEETTCLGGCCLDFLLGPPG